MIIIAGLALGTIISLVFFKKSGHHLSIPNNLTNFDNPLFLSNSHLQNDLVDAKLIEKDNEQNTQPMTTL